MPSVLINTFHDSFTKTNKMAGEISNGKCVLLCIESFQQPCPVMPDDSRWSKYSEGDPSPVKVVQVQWRWSKSSEDGPSPVKMVQVQWRWFPSSPGKKMQVQGRCFTSKDGPSIVKCQEFYIKSTQHTPIGERKNIED